MGSCHLILGSQLIHFGPLIWPVSDFGGTPRSGVKTQGGGPDNRPLHRQRGRDSRTLPASLHHLSIILHPNISHWPR